MILAFRVSSFICLLLAFIWHIGIETHRAAGSHAEEEEKKFNIVFGNLSFKSTLPPVEDSVTTEEPSSDNGFTDGDTDLSESNQSKKDTNNTEYDDLREDVRKNDASPENSVDREGLDENTNFYKSSSKLETSSVAYVDDEKESSTELNPSLTNKTSVPDSVSSEDVLDPFSDTNCTDINSKCKTTLNVDDEYVVSPRANEKVSLLTSSFFTPWSVSTPLWKPMRQQDNHAQLSSIIFTPFKTTTDSDTSVATTTETSTTVQTSENLIPVEGSAINKADSPNNTPVNKTEKAKPTKHSAILTSDFRNDRTVLKVSSTTPVTTTEKINASDEKSTPMTLISKMFEAVSVTTLIPTDSTDINLISPDLKSPEIVTPEFSDYNFYEKELVTPSSVLQFSDMPTEYHSRFLPFFNTETWNSGRSTISNDEDSIVTSEVDITPHLMPSFRESPSSTEMVKQMTTSSSSKDLTDSTTMTGSQPDLLVSTLQPQLNNGYSPKETIPVITSDKVEHIPSPRWTNPGCPSLPVCIEITLLDTSWEEFCSQAREFQEFLSKSVSHYIHSIHPHQVVLEAENCIQNPSIYPVQSSSDVTVALFITDDSGEYTEKLTEICALILRKWAPTTFRNSVMEVRLFNTELQATSIPVLPELNSGFVAAVSISAVAGVALCMLCILLVVMKQKLLQSRSSETTSPSADAYSLDSLSINASFRRRRNRRSARSYLNHAFSDQEIPSHPLNEKTLQNCLKNRDILEEEFRKIPMNMPKLNEIPEGAHVKNRFSNILPRPETRVVLADPSGDPLKCYINANYVKGYGGKASTYIACQAPLPEGVEEFWRMIWEQQCRVIIMLTMFEENGTSRCAVYFPQSTLITQPPYGDFQVSLLKKDVYEFYTMSTLRLLDLEKNLFRDVVHLWYTKWPDVGVPKDPSSLITFVQQCRSFINCNAGPTVVHCSTGTGRSGVFLALDLCMREYDESKSIDILQCVSQLRRDRGGAVQNKDQYILIHEAMLEYISRIANQSQRSSIQN